MSKGIDEFDPVLGYMPAIPEPFWVSSWRTLFRFRPECVECGQMFKSRDSYRTHYVLSHIQPVSDGNACL